MLKEVGIALKLYRGAVRRLKQRQQRIHRWRLLWAALRIGRRAATLRR